MPPRCTGLGAVVLLCAAVSAAAGQAPRRGSTRDTLRSDVSLELLGKSLLYTFAYQRMINRSFGLEVGLGVLGASSSTENTTVVFVPLGAKLYVIPRDGSLFVTGGAVVVSAAVDAGPFDEGASDIYGYGGLGFEFRSPGGFMFRGTAYGLFAEGGYFIWPGLTIGYAF
jgi:hypothetical protein